MPGARPQQRSRPEVVLTSTVSVDGRISLGRSQRLMDPDVGARWATIAVPGAFTDRQERLDAGAILEGSGSFVDIDSPAPEWPVSRSDDAAYEDYVPTMARRWFIVADSRGRVTWSFAGDDQMRLLVLVCRATPPGYLVRLRELQVPYLVVGQDRVDLRIALEKVRHTLGVERVIADSGGTLNATLLRQGLVDILDLVTLPGLVGGTGTPTMFDGPETDNTTAPIRLQLLGVEQHGDAIRTQYRVQQ